MKVVHIAEWIRPGGGPAGYLYNLGAGLARTGAGGVEVRALGSHQQRTSDPGGRVPAAGESKRGRFSVAVSCTRSFLGEWRRWLRRIPRLDELTADADAVVFHEARLASAYLRHVPAGVRASKRVYIMPHAPTDFTTERVDGWRAQCGGLLPYRAFRNVLARMEASAFREADGLVLASRHCLESYFNYNARYREILTSKRKFEILSGTGTPACTRPRDAVRRELLRGNDSGETIVAYFGRFHEHKGFDTFCQVARQSLSSFGSGLLFVTAGQGPLRPNVDDPLFVNLGWRTDIGDLISAMDLLLVPNKHAYFDLLVLEAMALGGAVATTAVGGSRAFAEIDSGVQLIAPGGAVPYLQFLRQVSAQPALLRGWGANNKACYDRLFALEPFVQRHRQLAPELLRDI